MAFYDSCLKQLVNLMQKKSLNYIKPNFAIVRNYVTSKGNVVEEYLITQKDILVLKSEKKSVYIGICKL